MPDMPSAPASRGVNSVDHALRLVSHMAEHGAAQGLTVAELAQALALPRPTLYRLLASLQEHEWVARVGKRYRLTLRLVALAQAAFGDHTLPALCQPHLQALAHKTGETTHFAVLDGNRAGYIAKVDGEHAIRMSSHVGWRGPLHATAAGKVLLAWSPDALLEQVTGEPLERYTRHTLTDPVALREQLGHIRKLGHALDDQELLDGLVCVAAPVLVQGRLIGAVSVSGPSTRRESLLYAAADVRAAGAAIAAHIAP